MRNEDKYRKYFEPWLVGKQNSRGETRAYCPLCENPDTSKSPSASLNFPDGVFNCQSCSKGTTILKLYKELNEGNVVDLWSRRGKKQATKKSADKKSKPLPTAKQVEAWHDRLMESDKHHRFMNETRGLTDDTLIEFQIGFDGSKYTIPIYDEDDKLVNVRKYNPKATEHRWKMVNILGHGSGRIYGLDVLEDNDEVVLAEGELDRLVARQQGIAAVTHTSGASVFNVEWAKLFAGKVVYVAYDDDESGDKGAARVAEVLKDVAHAVYRLRLKTGIKGGDITDFFVTLGLDMEDWELRKSSAEPLVKPPEPHKVPSEGKPVTLEESQNFARDEPVELTVMVAGKVEPPYGAPKRLLATCDQNAGAVCKVCPLASRDGEREVFVDADDERLMRFIDISDKAKHDLNRQLSGAKCVKHVTFQVQESYSIEELVVTPSVEDRGEDTQHPIKRQVYNVGTYATAVNQKVRIIAQQRADPRSQRGILQGWQIEPVHSDIDDFVLTPELREQLKVFQAIHQDPLDKCFEIARDLAANVTHIYGRDILHVAYDLVFHSAIDFQLGGKPIPNKGWLEALVIGDTRTGKSEAASRLIGHYQSGKMYSCESVTLAGLLGATEQVAGRHWMITWGALPLNDRRLVVLDEMSGLFSGSNGSHASKGILENLSSVRAMGKAQITKAASGETSARTRIIWITNPLEAIRLAELPGSALTALRDLVRQPEDIARFDFVLAAGGDDVAPDVINSMVTPDIHHVYTSQLCHQLITWAWSLKADDIRWVGLAEKHVMEWSLKMGNRYVPDPPLIQVENIRTKIARLAVAIAARTFAVEGTGNQLLVRTKHVKAAVRFLDMVYSNDTLGYKRHSDSVHHDREVAISHTKVAKKMVKDTDGLLRVLSSVAGRTFRPRDFSDLGGEIDPAYTSQIISQLREWRMITSGEHGRLRLEPTMIRIIKELEDEGHKGA